MNLYTEKEFPKFFDHIGQSFTWTDTLESMTDRGIIKQKLD